jgi:alkaline phosphatase D
MKFFRVSALTLLLTQLLFGCHHLPKKTGKNFAIAFGSCNRQDLENNLWYEIEKNHPNVWVWGGDIIYSDTYDMDVLQANYLKQKNNTAYKYFTQSTEIIGTWDDHDYGLNDGGVNYSKKTESQQIFLDFMDVAKDSPRRRQKGIYYAHSYKVEGYEIKIITLDTRYFRTALTPDPKPTGDHRYIPNTYGQGTMLGKDQWLWLEHELKFSKADFNVINSSIQVLSDKHGFEKWGNFPHELVKLENLVQSTHANNVIFLSGDRHISEFSKKKIASMDYPLIDFTSSGLTHAYNKEKIEPNPYRVGPNVVDNSFGLLKFNFKNGQVEMEIRGNDNKVLHKLVQDYTLK